ncbi:MAG: hypothetical protein ACR2G4_02010 [Pyrinomonadaceae bacterium]
MKFFSSRLPAPGAVNHFHTTRHTLGFDSTASIHLNNFLWHAKCFIEQWQAWKKLNHDPAAITSLSVACRYASRPPSIPQ